MNRALQPVEIRSRGVILNPGIASETRCPGFFFAATAFDPESRIRMSPGNQTAPGQNRTRGLWPVIRMAWNGNLHDAAVHLAQGGSLKTLAGRAVARWVVALQLREAAWHQKQQQFGPALDLLEDARQIASSTAWSRILRQREAAVRMSVAGCQQLLISGNWPAALDLLNDLARRDLLGADGPELLGQALIAERAELHASRGQWNDAIGLLRQLKTRAPRLEWVPPRVAWLCGKAGIAAEQETVRNIFSETQAPGKLPRQATRFDAPAAADPDPAHNRCSLTVRWTHSTRKSGDSGPDAPPDPPSRRMLLWIDGIGHYLLCLEPQLWMGRYVPLSGIQIPILADIHRRHLRWIRTASEGVRLQAFAPTTVTTHSPSPTGPGVEIAGAGRRFSSGKSCFLGPASRAIVQLGGAVRWEYRRARPDSTTAVIVPVSNHRTVPAATAVIWCGDRVVLGSGEDADILLEQSVERIELQFCDGLIRCCANVPIQQQTALAGPDFRVRSGIHLEVGGIRLVFEPLEASQEIPCGLVKQGPLAGLQESD